MVDRGRGTDKLQFHYKSLPAWSKERKLIHVKKPAIEVIFRKFSESKNEENREMRLTALLDSGADRSFLPREIATALQLDIDTTDERILTIAGDTNVYSSKVHVEIPRFSQFPVSVGLVNIYVMPYEVGEKQVPHFIILGRKDFFEKFAVTINETAQHIILKDVHKERSKHTRF